jgi:hypothetical protein
MAATAVATRVSDKPCLILSPNIVQEIVIALRQRLCLPAA